MSATPPDRWAALQPLLLEALDLEPDARRAFIAGQDPEWADDLAELLAAADAVPAFLDAPARWTLGDAPDHDLAGTQVGPYTLVRELGRGGQGRVFLARRDDVGTEVALKLVRSSLAAPDLVPRFLAERRVLGRLEHPHIARLLDAGSAETGPAGEQTPYVVMEAVYGVPITDYARSREAPLGERLRLFLQVCDAVAYAHRRLVVHRDLKPSNILVRGSGAAAQVKLLDFGIAKLLDEAADGEALTRTGLRLMTPEYAAPEQVLGQPVAVATDVYALGVLLYELLTGERPYDVSGGLRGVVRAVCDEMPAPPSSRGGRALRGDLDTIVLRALAKAPDDRYATAEALADDLRRYRTGLPVQARRQTVRYRAARFLRRNAVATGAGALGVLLLIGFGVRERTLRVEAEQARTEVQATADLLDDIFGATADGEDIRPDTLRAEALIMRAARRLDARLGGQPRLKASLTLRTGRLYDGIRQHVLAQERYREAERLARQASDADAILARTLLEIAYGQSASQRCQESVGTYNELLGLRDALDSDLELQVDAQSGRGAALMCLGRYPEAVADLQAAQDLLDRRPDEDGGFTLHSLGDALHRSGRTPEAIAALRRSIERAEALYPPGHPIVTARRDWLSALLVDAGDLVAAEEVARHSYSEALGADSLHHRALGAQGQLVHVLRRRGHLVEADALTEDLVRVMRETDETETVLKARSYRLRALVLLDLGRLNEAEAWVRNALAVPDDPMGSFAADRATNYRTLRDILVRAGRGEEADRAEAAAVAVEAEVAARQVGG